MTRRTRILIAGIVLLTTLALWFTRRPPAPLTLRRQPVGIMGTNCTLAATAAAGTTAEAALVDAEASLRSCEALLSNWLDDSEISQLNAAAPGIELPVSTMTREVLQAAQAARAETGGAFDIACGPLLALWRRASQGGQPPAPAAIAAARQHLGDAAYAVSSTGAVRQFQDVALDLGGIAKGYGIDLAITAMRNHDISSALVEVGGDLRWFTAGADLLPVDLRNPFGDGTIGQLRVGNAAVCTSGSYARYFEIAGRRYSHIVDPRSGWPVEQVPSVTVVAATAMVADCWATALSVLGPDGIASLPAGVEALIITGGAPATAEVAMSSGFGTLLQAPLTLPVKTP